MKIVHIIIGLNIGGAELMLKRLILKSQSRGAFQHEVISLMDLGPIGKDLREQGITVHTLNMFSILSSPVVSLRLYKLLKNIQPDIVQTWMYHSDLIGGLVAKSLGIKSIIWGIRTTDVSQGASKMTVYLSKICAKLSYYVPDAIICAAQVSKDYHISIGYDASKMIVIPNGFNIEELTTTEQDGMDVRQEIRLSKSDIVVGSVGRFNSVKNQKLFVEAAAEILKKYPNTKFIVVGRDNNWENTKLTSWINSYNISENFRLLGQRSDVAKCLKAMDIFFLHSKTEGFPNVLGEAMVAECICISNNVGDAKLLINGLGKLIEHNSPLEFLRAFEEVTQLSKEEEDEMLKAASRRIKDSYSLDTIVDKYDSVYRRFI